MEAVGNEKAKRWYAGPEQSPIRRRVLSNADKVRKLVIKVFLTLALEHVINYVSTRFIL